jgi:amino acid transporter, AAT family
MICRRQHDQRHDCGSQQSRRLSFPLVEVEVTSEAISRKRNAFGDRPTRLGEAANVAARAALTFALAVATFVAYYFFAAERLLHEPQVVGALHGNALGFLDWFALVALLYVRFGSWPLRAPAPEPLGEPVADPSLSWSGRPTRPEAPTKPEPPSKEEHP